jgi:hypothetical protein
VSDAIDNWQDANRRIKKQFGLETGFKHRYYFHWGYDGNPRKTAGHQDYFREKEELRGLDRKDQEKLFRELLSLWKGKKRKLENTIQRQMPFLPRGERQAFAVVLYQIHILGDYSTKDSKEIQPLMYLNDIAREITRDGLNRLFGSSNPASVAIRGRTWHMRHVGIREEQRQAWEMLHILMTHLPMLMYAKMREPFSISFGIPLREESSWQLLPDFTLQPLF